MSRCAMCGKPIATNTVTSSTVKQLLNGGPNATYGNESQFCICSSVVQTLPIHMWTEEQLRAFVAQEVAKALREIKAPPIFKYGGDEEALRERVVNIANYKGPELMLVGDASCQEVPNEEIQQGQSQP